jgi:hypothetical protein
MPDVPYPPEPEPTRAEEFYQVVWGAGGAVDAQVRHLVTGDRKGNLRRPILFVIVALGLFVPGLGVFAIPALIVLALTDQVIPL